MSALTTAKPKNRSPVTIQIRLSNPNSLFMNVLVLRLSRLSGPLIHLFVATPLALPNRKDRVRIAGILINRPVRRNYFTVTSRANPPASRTLFNVDLQRVVFCHKQASRGQTFRTANCLIPPHSCAGAEL
jgi:hypothetical protein